MERILNDIGWKALPVFEETLLICYIDSLKNSYFKKKIRLDAFFNNALKDQYAWKIDHS